MAAGYASRLRGPPSLRKNRTAVRTSYAYAYKVKPTVPSLQDGWSWTFLRGRRGTKLSYEKGMLKAAESISAEELAKVDKVTLADCRVTLASYVEGRKRHWW